jgi:hypothetical protein
VQPPGGGDKSKAHGDLAMSAPDPSGPAGRSSRWAIPIVTGVLVLASAPARAAEMTPLDVSLQSQGFALVGQAHGVKQYKHRTAKIVRIAAEGVIPAPIADVREMVLDYRRQAGKVDRVKQSRILRQGAGWMLVYQRLDLPVINDRDFTLRLTWGEAPAHQWIVFDAANAQGPPPQRGVVRVTEHSGSWQLKAVEGGRATFARFQTRIDLGGSLPHWLARSGAGKELPTLFANLCRLIEARRRSRSCD